MSTEIMISGLTFASIILFAFGIYAYLAILRERRELKERIKQIGEDVGFREGPGFLDGFRGSWTKMVMSLGNRVKPKREDELSHLKKTFLKAGCRNENVTVIFFGIKSLLAILFFVIVLLLRFWTFKTMTSPQFMLFSIIMALIGFYLPNLWLTLRIAGRKEKITLGLPDALDLMVVCVESGNGLDAAINRVGEEMRLSNRVLSDEFRLVGLEMRAGKQRQEALKNLAMRADVEDVTSLVTLLVQTDRFGTSIGQALRVHSDSMRTKRYQKAEEWANKIPIKLLFPLLFFIFPSLLVVVLGPAIITIMRTLIKQ